MQVVHHFPAPRVPLFESMRNNRMRHDGRLVIATRPQTAFDYPLFEGARKVWVANQPSSDELASDLTAAVSLFIMKRAPCHALLRNAHRYSFVFSSFAVLV